MTGRLHQYFAGDHTAKGFRALYQSNFQGLDRVFVLNGSSNAVKGALIKKLANKWRNKGFDVELVHCSTDQDSMDALVIPQLKVGVYGAEEDFRAAGSSIDYIYTDRALDTSLVESYQRDRKVYQEELAALYEAAHESFATGLHIHDGLEEIYINKMDFKKADQVAEELIDTLYGDMDQLEKSATVKHRFFGASTPAGVVDYIPNLTDDLKKRYFIKGRAGTGKSTLLKKIAAAGEALGLDVEIYHCGFDPDSLDMVVVRELGFCIFDSTDPHEYFPDKDSDEVVDLYERTVEPDTDERYDTAIKILNRSYKYHMKKGVGYLHEAKMMMDEFEGQYSDAIDFAKLGIVYETIDDAILHHAAAAEQ
ncbi:hypothetical protein [Thalassobacillus hwangdonensis]|uniref:Nucleotide kinase n=1 Tax=Thalassobacillus hwangdonensis TaxID=546108 RepID=A0ABW3L120_9BACI